MHFLPDLFLLYLIVNSILLDSGREVMTGGRVREVVNGEGELSFI